MKDLQQGNAESPATLTPAHWQTIKDMLSVGIRLGGLPCNTISLLRGSSTAPSVKAEALLTVKQAATFTSLHPESIRCLCRKGILPHRRLGHRTVRITESALNEYLESKAVAAFTSATVEG